MKKVKIYALPSHASKERTSGVDFVRIIQPMTYLNGYKDKDVEIQVDIFEVKDKTHWLKVAEDYDVIYFNYLNNPWGYAAMGAMARKFKRKVIMDLDDNLWEIRSDNPAYSVYHKGSEAINNFTAICNDVDYITTTNSYLKNVIVNNTYKRHEKVKVFPNYIDLSKYSHISPFKNNGTIQLLHYGSTTHFDDLSNEEFIKGVDRILKEYPNVSVKFVGAFLPKLKIKWGQRYETAFGDTDIHKWVKEKFPLFMDQADILITPLEENRYTRCKSDIKFIEASSAKKPGVYQKIRQYEETITDGMNGYLAKTENEWYEKIKILIDNAKIRERTGEAAYRKVKEERQIQTHVKDYAEFIKQILTDE